MSATLSLRHWLPTVTMANLLPWKHPPLHPPHLRLPVYEESDIMPPSLSSPWLPTVTMKTHHTYVLYFHSLSGCGLYVEQCFILYMYT